MDAWKAREGFELTFLPFFVKAVVEALRENPQLNARWSDQGVVLKKRIHIGIAIAVPNGLVVPVVRDADQKNIAGLALSIREIVTRARSGRLTMDDFAGGTFTVNNTGRARLHRLHADHQPAASWHHHDGGDCQAAGGDRRRRYRHPQHDERLPLLRSSRY